MAHWLKKSLVGEGGRRGWVFTALQLKTYLQAISHDGINVLNVAVFNIKISLSNSL